MVDFIPACALTRHLARELLMLLFDHGLDVNYIRPADGLSPVMFAIKTSNLQLLRLLMLVPNLDVNMRAQSVPNYPNSKYYQNQPILHMIVLQNDYEMLKIFLNVPDSLTEKGTRR